MKCELTQKTVCYLTYYKGFLISIKYTSEKFRSREEFLNALSKLKNEKQKAI